TSFWEHWNLAPDRLTQELGVRSGEGCCTYNLIRLSNDLFRMLRNPKYVEYVERASLNHIMGSIHPENGDFMYFHTQYPGSFKTFGKNEECFWCCTGTGMENHLRYGQSVFFGQADTLYVAQFFPSKLDWTEKGLKIEQVSEFPYEEGSRLNIIEGKAKASLKIRIPSWSEGFSVKVNGDDIKWNSENGFCCINRTWKKGDYVEVSFPMHLRLETLADHPRKSAILYGPLVLAGNLGSEGVTKDRVHVTDNYFNGFPDYMNPTTPVPMLTGSMENLDWLTKTEGKMEFTTSATSDGCTLTLLPLYKAVDMRFTDYFEFAGDLSPVALEYPVEKLNAKPVTLLENGVEYAIKNANATLSNTNFYWDGINVRTHSTGSVDDVKVIATSVEEGDETYWTFTISSSAFQNQYLGRTNHANVQATGVKTLWIAEYNESADVQGSGFLLRMKADSAEGGHEMMMNGDATWVVAWVGDHGSDYTPNTSHWQFYKVSDLNLAAMAEYNEVNLTLYKYLVEAQQMYDRGIRSMAEVYNKAIVVYTNPDNTLEQLKAAIEEIRAAIAASVTCYEVGIPATYGIINPGFENLSNQRGVAGNEMKAGPFGWDLKRDGEIVTNPTWWWCSINSDGNMYKEGNYVWGIWDYTYGDIELSQTLTGLANGEWKLSARLMNNHTEANNHARIFLNNSCMLAGNEEDYTWLPDESQHYFLGAWSNADNDMQHQFVLTTTITDGTLYFGVHSNGFFKVDDFRLTYLGDPSNLSFPTQSPLLKSEVIYDLQGRMVGNNFQQLKPGIYITAGKKIVKI
ncbi:MAG: glycoside hydrolase family 127 protein, partial [Bacteroidaceae bacterium]|nr:glycoside hydrolase family 127 protein [Bacteroidaceae bacterium]